MHTEATTTLRMQVTDMNDYPAWNIELRVKFDSIKKRKQLPSMNEYLAQPQRQKEISFEHSEG
jgi:hypothetical protein